MGSYASLSVRLSVRPSVCHWIIIHISESIKFYCNRILVCGYRVGRGLVLWTGRAHCQRQVAFLSPLVPLHGELIIIDLVIFGCLSVTGQKFTRHLIHIAKILYLGP